MIKIKNIILLLFAVALLATSTMALAADKKEEPNNEVIELGWTKRCPETKETKGKVKCEVFQRISVKESQMRVAEFAIGFPDDEKLPKGTARGVVVLPLGILLEQGITMAIDDGKPAAFKARFCINAGCFSFVNLSKDLLDQLKKGNTVKFQFKVSTGQDVNLIMSLNGFSKALKSIE